MASLGFGIERMGLPAMRYPRAALVVFMLISLLAGLGLSRLKHSGVLSEMFRSSSVNFANYEKLNRLFPTNEYDLSILIKGKNLLTPKRLDDIRNIQLELEFADGVSGMLSMFSLRDDPDEKGYAPPLFPADIPTDAKQFARLVQKLKNHSQVMGKFLALGSKGEDDIIVLVATLKHGATVSGKLGGILKGIKKTIQEQIKGTGLTYVITGSPELQQELRNAIRHDRITFNVTGFTLGVLIAFFFLRRPVLVFISSICPAFAVLWIMGALGHAGQPVNSFINVLPPLIMVITLPDAMHMVFAILKGLRAGESKAQAVREAVLRVGPACVLTSLTTTIALLSMALTDSAGIRSFGLAAAGGTFLAFIVVIILVPALSMLLIGDEKSFLAREGKGHDPLSWLDGACTAISHFVNNHWLGLTLAGLFAGALFTSAHFMLEPRYRLSDQVPGGHGALQAMELIDQRLSGSQKLAIMVTWPKNLELSDNRVIEAIGEAHRLLAAQKQVRGVSSLESIRRHLNQTIDAGQGKYVAEYVRKLPENIAARHVNEKERTALVAGMMKNLEAAQIAPVVNAIKPALTNLEKEYPGFKFTLAGLAMLSAMESTSMISQLNRSLLLAIIVVIALLGLAFRSLSAAMLSIVPNLFPIVTVGAFLYLSGHGLQFASVMGLTVAFGLAVDDTIHFLNRYEHERRRDGNEGLPGLVGRVSDTVAHIGPVLILTTMVLLCGLSVTSLSDLPVTRLFGQLSMATLAAALVADLLILPSLIITSGRIGLLKRGLATGKA